MKNFNDFINSKDDNKIVTCNSIFPKNFKSISISIAGEEDINKWSYGEVKKSETINYRKLKPERSGLFCAKIFGPINDFECLCKKYKKEKFAGITCNKCGVLVTSSKVRRYRMGHIALSSKVIHPWYINFNNNPIGHLLGISKSSLEDISNFKLFIATKDSFDEKIKKGTIINSSEFYNNYIEEYEYCFESGGDAIYEMLAELDLQKLKEEIKKSIENDNLNENLLLKLKTKLDLINNLVTENINPKNMVISLLPVLPADLRPLVSLEGGRFASSDINDLYKKVINRNNRLKKLQNLEAPRIIIDNEKSILAKSVRDILEPASKKQTKNPKKSISDAIKGKQGIFRKNLLGKRCDFSGRAVIIPGPDLKLDQCGLPRKMMLKLFEPIINRELQQKGLAINLTESRKMIKDGHEHVWPILNEISKNWPVILNRAPTLHKLSIQAFKPIPIDGNSIRLHPLVCTGFNADFDGDQMAVHLPICEESIEECKKYMMSINNVILPSNGTPVIVPTKDIVLGLYYLTSINNEKINEKFISNAFIEITTLLEFGKLKVHSPIYFFIEDIKGKRKVLTTPGRLIIWNILPKKKKLEFDMINTVLKRTEISNLVTYIYTQFSHKESLKFLDAIKNLGFEYITKSGISISDSDAKMPEDRNQLLKEVEEKNDLYKTSFFEGFMTEEEMKNKIIENWVSYIEKISESVVKSIKENEDDTDRSGVKNNNIFMMIDSGARGSKHQIQQLCGIRGIMAKPSGEIHDDVITSNLKVGLNQFDYFDSTHGERKGLSDLALKTSKAGYFTRRLVDCAHGCYIESKDCGSQEYITISKKEDPRIFNFDFYKELFGKTLAEDIIDLSGQTIATRNTIITQVILDKIQDNKIDNIKVRSIVHCNSREGLCVFCYGMDISTLKIVDQGLCVGILAAQSIGEPGTQLTMRTIHFGGAITSETRKSTFTTKEEGYVDLSEVDFGINSENLKVVTNYTSKIKILNSNNESIDDISLKAGSILLVDQNQYVTCGDILFNYDDMIIPIVAANSGKVNFHNMIEGVSFDLEKDEHTSIERIQICGKSSTRFLFPYLTISNENNEKRFYNLPKGTILLVKNGQTINKGDYIGKMLTKFDKAKDITGGLPKVIDIFESRKNIKRAIISYYEGIVNIQNKSDGKHSTINILDINLNENNERNILASYNCPSDNIILVQDGFKVQKGDKLTDGSISLTDMLNTMGVNYVIKHLISSILNIYIDQGVHINCKHIEVIVRHMLKKVIVKKLGGLTEEEINKYKIKKDGYENFSTILHINKKLRSKNLEEISYINCIYGITKIASDFSDSFISSASFQNTIKVLVRASLKNEVDDLSGTKERVILGRPILQRKKTILQ